MGSMFKTRNCENCGHQYEENFYACPNCDIANPLVTNNRKDTRMSSWKQIVMFLVGNLGFQALGILFSVLVGLFYRNIGLVGDEYNVGFSLAVNGSAYFVEGAILVILAIKEKDNVFKKIHIKPILFGLIGFAIMYAVNLVGGVINNIVYTIAGIEETTNANQASVIEMVKAFPIMSFLMIVILGPVCEELTYRVGLFSFLRKKHVGLAIVGSALIFGLIHFGYKEAFSGDPKLLIVEVMSFFNYFSAGIVLGIFYHKCGFYASLTAHIANNLYSYVGIWLLDLLQRMGILK